MPNAVLPIASYYQDILVPSNTSVSAMRRNGMPVNADRCTALMQSWQKDCEQLEQWLEGEAKKKGFSLDYDRQTHQPDDRQLRDYLYSADGLGLDVYKYTPTGTPSTDDEALKVYADVGSTHRDDDEPHCYAIKRIRSISKARGTHVAGLLKAIRADGCVHARINWTLDGTTRLSMEEPPLQQLPERADPNLAKQVKSCIVPRIKPWLGNPDDWDPRKHGWCAKIDVKGAEAVLRSGCIAKCRVSVPYLRSGGDMHSKSASIFYGVPEGTYKKGTYQRDSVGKPGYFLLIFGGSWKALQRTIWKEARIWIEDDDAKAMHQRFFGPQGYPDLKTQYKRDVMRMFEHGYIEDLYGRRWFQPPVPGVRLRPGCGDEVQYDLIGLRGQAAQVALKTMSHLEHLYANKPTQCSQGTTTLWYLALLHHGEYVDLQVPECWSHLGVPFPDVAKYQLNEGTGPGGKPFKVYVMNTVHDSAWSDGAPGTLEPAAKLFQRRANGIPAPFLAEANMPWRVEMEVGPDLGHLRDYNTVAKQFGLEPIPDR